MSQEKIRRLRERQEERRRKREKRRRLSHIDEAEMVEPAKQSFKELLLGDGKIVEWYREPSVQIRERKNNESPAVVHEKPDLICEIDVDGKTLLYVIELKKVLGKKAIGQALLYYWAVDNGIELKCDGYRRELPESVTIFSAIGFIKMKQQYYGDFISWLAESVTLKRGQFTTFPVDMSKQRT